MRVRTSSNPSQVIGQTSVSGVFYDGKASDPEYSYPVSGAAYTRNIMGPSTSWRMEDVVTEDYKKRIAQGEIINNPMVTISSTYTPSIATPYDRMKVQTYVDGYPYGDRYTGMLNMTDSYFKRPWVDPEDIPGYTDAKADLIDQAVSKAHSNTDPSELQALVMAGEFSKTVSSLSAILARVYKIVKAAKRLDVKYLRKQVSKKELSDRYMELRYALRPLAYDVKGVMEASNALSGPESSRATARGFATDSFSHETTQYEPFSGFAFTLYNGINMHVDARAGVLTDVTLSEGNVLGFTSIFESAWELIPFSFIIDWFLNVGTTISALTPKAGVEQLASWVVVTETYTQYQRLDDSISTLSDVTYDVANYIDWYGIRTNEVVRKERIVNPSVAVWPQFVLRLDPLKLLDLAIIMNKFK